MAPTVEEYCPLLITDTCFGLQQRQPVRIVGEQDLNRIPSPGDMLPAEVTPFRRYDVAGNGRPEIHYHQVAPRQHPHSRRQPQQVCRSPYTASYPFSKGTGTVLANFRK